MENDFIKMSKQIKQKKDKEKRRNKGQVRGGGGVVSKRRDDQQQATDTKGESADSFLSGLSFSTYQENAFPRRERKEEGILLTLFLNFLFCASVGQIFSSFLSLTTFDSQASQLLIYSTDGQARKGTWRWCICYTHFTWLAEYLMYGRPSSPQWKIHASKSILYKSIQTRYSASVPRPFSLLGSRETNTDRTSQF